MSFIDELGRTARTSGDVASEKKDRQAEIRETIIQKSITDIKNNIQYKAGHDIFDAPVGAREVTVEYDFVNSYDFISGEGPGPSIPFMYELMANEGQKIYKDGVILYTCKAKQLGFDSKGYLELTNDGIAIIKKIQELLLQDGIYSSLFLDAISIKTDTRKHKKKEVKCDEKAKFWVSTVNLFYPKHPTNPTIPHVYYGLKCTVRF